MNFKKWVKCIKTAGYNGARTVFKIPFYHRSVSGYLKLGGQVVMWRSAAAMPPPSGAFYSAKNWVGNCPPATYAPVSFPLQEWVKTKIYLKQRSSVRLVHPTIQVDAQQKEVLSTPYITGDFSLLESQTSYRISLNNVPP